MVHVPASRVITMRQNGKSTQGTEGIEYPSGTPTPAPSPPVINVIAGNDVINASETTSPITGTSVACAAIALTIGANIRSATANGSGIWSYTPVAGELAALGQGARTIRATATLAGVTSAETTRNITIDTIASTVSSVVLSGVGAVNDFLNEGDIARFTVTNSKVLNVNTAGGVPRIAHVIGAAIVYASYVSGSGSNTLIFERVIQAGDTDADGISVAANSIQQNGATISDSAGNPATLTHGALADNGSWKVDTTAPVAPTVALGIGIADGATIAEATAETGVITVNAEADSVITVLFTGGADSLTKTATGTGASVPIVLTLEDIAIIGTGTINQVVTATDRAGNVSPAVHLSFTLVAEAGPTPLPATSDLAYHFSAGDITPQADNTALASWTDHVAGISMSQATSGLRPKYRTARTNSLPAVQFEGGQVLPLGRPAALLDALARQNNSTGVTMFFVMANIDQATGSAFRSFWSPSAVNNSRSLMINGTGAGARNQGRGSNTSGLQVIVVERSSIISNGDARFFQNGNAFTAGDLSPDGSANYVLGGDVTNAVWTLKGDVLECGCYNKALTTADVMRLTKWACDKYGAAYPWASAAHYVVIDSDSQGAGVGATHDSAWPTVMMAAKGQPFGAYSNFAVSGRTSNAMTASVPANYSELSEVLGLPVLVNAFEFYNQPDAAATGIKAWAAAVRAAQPNAKIALGTSIDNGNISGETHTNRPAFNAAVAASTVSYDVLVPLHTSPDFGVDGACPNAPGPYTPNFADNIHMNATGQALQATFWGPYYDTLVGLLP